MALKEATGSKTTLKKTTDWSEGETVKGIYVKTREGQFGPLHDIELADNAGCISVAGCGILDYKLSEVAENTEVQITYKGKTTLESGNFKGKQAHDFAVMYDDGK